MKEIRMSIRMEGDELVLIQKIKDLLSEKGVKESNIIYHVLNWKEGQKANKIKIKKEVV